MHPRALSPVLLHLLVLALLPASLIAEVRTWRDQESDIAVDAELVEVEGDKITLKLPNGKSYTYPVTRFHREDQVYVKEWAEEHEEEMAEKKKSEAVAPENVRRALQVTVKPQKAEGVSERTGDKDTKGKKRTDSTHFEINLTNARSGPPMTNVTVDYTVYTRKRTSDTKDREGNRTLIEKTEESATVASLLPGTASVVKTKAVTTSESTTAYKEDKKSYEKRLSEEVVGVLVKVSVDGAAVTTVEQPSGLLRTVEKGE